MAERPAQDPSGADAATIRAAHDDLVTCFGTLLDILLDERKALIDPARHDLAGLVVRKEAVCSEIAARQQALLAHLPPSTVLPTSMEALRRVAERCRDENAVNGRIANRARHSTRTLLGILTGITGDETYQRKPGERGGNSGHLGQRLGSA